VVFLASGLQQRLLNRQAILVAVMGIGGSSSFISQFCFTSPRALDIRLYLFSVRSLSLGGLSVLWTVLALSQ